MNIEYNNLFYIATKCNNCNCNCINKMYKIIEDFGKKKNM